MPVEDRENMSNSSRVHIDVLLLDVQRVLEELYSSEQLDSVPEEVSSCKVIPAEERFGVEMHS